MFADQDPADADDELVTLAGSRCDLWGTDGYSEWNWGDFSLRVFAYEYDTTGATDMDDVAWFLFRCDIPLVSEIPWTLRPALVHVRSGVLNLEDPWKYGYLNIWDPDGKVAFMTIDEILNSTTDPYPDYRTMYNLTTAAYPVEADRIQAAIDARYKYDRDGNGQIRIFTRYVMGNNNPAYPEWESYDVVKSGWEWLKKDLAYTTKKTFIMTGIGGNVSAEVWTGLITYDTLNRNISGTSGSGRIVLYARTVDVAWDDIRIISSDGHFTSQTTDMSATYPGGVAWGTVVGTLTIPSSAVTAGANLAATFETSSDGGTSWQSASSSTNQITSGNGTSIKYRAALTTSNNKETPVLEDVTITYLPKVEIVSYSLSEQ